MYTDETCVKMPLWAKAVLIFAVATCALILNELMQGNRAILILLGCAFALIFSGLWQAFRKDNHEHTD